MSDAHQMKSAADVKAFALAGNATLTLVSKKTGTRFTFKIRKPDANKPHFVSLLNGPSNEDDFQFLGSIFNENEYRHGSRSRLVFDAPSAVAFRWFWSAMRRDLLPEQLEVWHEGRCGRCGRKLTVPESIENGLGPECAKRRAGAERETV